MDASRNVPPISVVALTAPEQEAQGTLRETDELLQLLGRGRDEWLEITQTRPLAYSTAELETAQRVAQALRRLADALDSARLLGRDTLAELIGQHDDRVNGHDLAAAKESA